MNPCVASAQELYEYMKTVLATVGDEDGITMSVVPMWRATRITGRITPIPDATVPPPPMPITPQPPPDPEPEQPVGHKMLKY